AAHGSLALVLIEASKERGHRASRLHRLRIGDQFLEVASRRARSHIPEHRSATWEESILARAGGMAGRAPELTEEELASLEPGNLEAGRRRHRRLRGERSIGRGHRERTHDEEARCRPARDDVNGFRRPIPWDTAPRAADTLRSSHVSSPWRVARSVARWTRRACGKLAIVGVSDPRQKAGNVRKSAKPGRRGRRQRSRGLLGPSASGGDRIDESPPGCRRLPIVAEEEVWNPLRGRHRVNTIGTRAAVVVVRFPARPSTSSARANGG